MKPYRRGGDLGENEQKKDLNPFEKQANTHVRIEFE